MAAVWQGSRHSGSELLMLLAIADFSDDQGRAFPSISRLAVKCRTKPRYAMRLLASLLASGELEVRKGKGMQGPGGTTNLYRIALNRLAPQAVTPGALVTQSALVTQGAAGSEPEDRKVVSLGSHEPSLNHQEPSIQSKRHPKTSACPHRELLKMFAAKVGELPHPRPETWIESKSGEAMAARWAWVTTATRENGERYAETPADGLAWFEKFFDRVAVSDFLTGRDGKWTKCSLHWLVKKDNFAKVVDGNYSDRVA